MKNVGKVDQGFNMVHFCHVHGVNLTVSWICYVAILICTVNLIDLLCSTDSTDSSKSVRFTVPFPRLRLLSKGRSVALQPGGLPEQIMTDHRKEHLVPGTAVFKDGNENCFCVHSSDGFP